MDKFKELHIRKCATENRLDFSAHALERMGRRKIRRNQVYDSIANGKIVEEQYHGLDFKYVFQEATDNKPNFYVVIADTPIPYVITVCNIKNEIWDYLDDRIKRKGKNKNE